MRSLLKEKLSDSLVGLGGGENEDTEDFARVLLAVEKNSISMAGPKVDGMRLLCCLRDGPEDRQKAGFESSWTGVLRAFNLFQFLPWAFVMSKQGIRKGLYEEAATTARPSEKPEGDPYFKKEWEEIRRLVDQALYSLIDCLAANNCPVPEPGYELMAETGEIIACAGLAWEELQIALLREEEIGYRPLFESADWRVFLVAEVMTNPQQFCAMLDKVIWKPTRHAREGGHPVLHSGFPLKACGNDDLWLSSFVATPWVVKLYLARPLIELLVISTGGRNL